MNGHYLSAGFVHEYDVALKGILMRRGSALLNALAGVDHLRWLNVEMPRVRNLGVDMLGEVEGGEFIQIEFQSRNEKHLPLRMGEHLFTIGRMYGRMPRQIVLYVGDEPMRMTDRIEGKDFCFHFHLVDFHLVDVRDLDSEALLASPNLGDNVIALLTRFGNRSETLRQILERTVTGPAESREEAMAELLIVAGLRKLGDSVRKEAKKMPILNDIMDHEVIGPLLRQGRAEGQLDILLGQVERRFGTISPEFRQRIDALSSTELKAASLRLLDATRFEDLFAN